MIVGGLFMATMETAATVKACLFMRRNSKYRIKIIYVTEREYLIYVPVGKHVGIVLHCFVFYMEKLKDSNINKEL